MHLLLQQKGDRENFFSTLADGQENDSTEETQTPNRKGKKIVKNNKKQKKAGPPIWSKGAGNNLGKYVKEANLVDIDTLIKRYIRKVSHIYASLTILETLASLHHQYITSKGRFWLVFLIYESFLHSDFLLLIIYGSPTVEPNLIFVQTHLCPYVIVDTQITLSIMIIIILEQLYF